MGFSGVMIDGNVFPQYHVDAARLREFASRVYVDGKCVYAGPGLMTQSAGLVPCLGLSAREAARDVVTLPSGEVSWPLSKPVLMTLHERGGKRQLAVQSSKDGGFFVAIPKGMGAAQRPVIADKADDSGRLELTRVTVQLADGSQVDGVIKPW